MSQIYPLSDNVIIWIGPESEDSTHALETLRYFSEQVFLQPRGSDQYEVVGPCFVHGLMLGEALKPPLEPP